MPPFLHSMALRASGSSLREAPGVRRQSRVQPSVIVRMALMALRGAVTVAVVVMAMAVVVMGVIMAATAALAMGVVVVMRMGVLVTMVMVVAVVLMAVMTVVMMMAMVVIVVVIMAAAAIIAMVMMMHLRLRLERALDRRHGTALPAHELSDGGDVDDVERIGRHLGRDMVAAEMPGEAHQPQRVLGANFQQALQRSLDLDEAAILELERIAIVEHCGLVEIDREFQPARRLH